MGLTLISLAYAVAVVMQADTSRPPIPNNAVAGPGPLLEIPSRSSSRFTYHRNRFDVWFADSTSGVTIRSFLTRFDAVIVGGFDFGPGNAFYIVLVPDPGPTWGAIDSLVQLMVRHPGVVRVGPSAFRSMILRGQARADTSVPAIRDGFTPPRDTSVPTIPDGFSPPGNPLLVVLPGDAGFVMYRDVVVVAFRPGIGGAVIRDLFRRYNARVVGGSPFMETYYLRLPDPGPTYAQARAVERALQLEPSLEMAGLVYERRPPPEPNGSGRP